VAPRSLNIILIILALPKGSILAANLLFALKERPSRSRQFYGIPFGLTKEGGLFAAKQLQLIFGGLQKVCELGVIEQRSYSP